MLPRSLWARITTLSLIHIFAENDIKFYTIDGISIGKEIGLGGRINTILQAAFFKIANIIPIDDAVKFMKDAATKSYSKKGCLLYTSATTVCPVRWRLTWRR